MPRIAGMVREWCRVAVDELAEGSFTIPDLADEALAEFARDPGFTADAMKEYVRPLLYHWIQQEIGRTRSLARIGDVAFDEANAPTRLRISTRWQEWLENVGGRHKRLMDCTRSDLNMAINERMKRIQSEHLICRTWGRLAQELGPGQRVRERFTPEEIDRVYRDEKEEDQESAA